MNTAIKANKNISTAPATGKTIGIMGTISSTTSWASSWGAAWGADMGFLSKNRERADLAREESDFTHKAEKCPLRGQMRGGGCAGSAKKAFFLYLFVNFHPICQPGFRLVRDRWAYATSTFCLAISP